MSDNINNMQLDTEEVQKDITSNELLFKKLEESQNILDSFVEKNGSLIEMLDVLEKKLHKKPLSNKRFVKIKTKLKKMKLTDEQIKLIIDAMIENQNCVNMNELEEISKEIVKLEMEVFMDNILISILLVILGLIFGVISVFIINHIRKNNT